MLTLAEKIGEVFRFIEPQEQTKIFKRLNGVSNFRINGFTKIEKVPLRIILNKCKIDQKAASILLESVVCECFGQKGLEKYVRDEEPLPTMTKDNGPGIMAIAALQNQADDYMEALFSEYEALIEVEDEQEITPEMDKEHKILAEENTTPGGRRGGHFMETYIGFIQEANHFFNFWPVYEYRDGQCFEIEDKLSAFPRYGNVNISGERRMLEANIADQEIYVISFSADDLEDNIKYDGSLNSTEFKLNYIALKNEKKIRNIAEIGLYPVVHPVSGTKNFAFGDIQIIENADESDLALVQFDNKLYGPYNVKIKDQKYFVCINETRNHIVDAFVPKQGTIESNLVDIPADRDGTTITHNIFVDNFEKIACDLISDEQIISEFCSMLSESGASTKKEFSIAELSDVLTSNSETLFSNISDYPTIRENRLSRMKELLADEDFRDRAYKDVTKIFATLLATAGNSDSFKDLLGYVLEDPTLSSKIQSFDIVRQNVAEKQAELKELTSRISDEKQKQVKVEQTEEISALQEKLAEKEQEIKKYQENENIRISAEQAKEDLIHYRRSYQEVKDEFERVETNIKETLDNASAQAARIAFEPMLSSKLLEAAASWENGNMDEDYRKISEETSCFSAAEMSPEDLCRYVCDSVKKYRPGYEDNDILNILINMTQNFLTVFSGNPGTGKTSICNIVAHILGLGKIQKQLTPNSRINTRRYVPISVERGWTTKRDFIGYYNPLSKQVEKANAHLYDGFRILSVEGRKSTLPFVVLLDEANLSPMEYYWADFMNICDKNGCGNYISLGGNYQFYVPETCRFVATINNDHTTEILSPRLIDRSAVIVLPEVSYQQVIDEALEDDSFVQIISWQLLKRVFDVSEESELPRIPKDIYENQICPCLKKLGISVSPRTDKAIKRFHNTAATLFETDKNGTDPSIIALDYAIAQRLLTKINGSGDAYRDALEELRGICGKANVNLTRCADVLSRILAKGDSALHYYQFF